MSDQQTKEQIYDEKIAPLIDQIIEVCNKHGIETLMHFYISIPEDEHLCCTTSLPNGEHRRTATHMLLLKTLEQAGLVLPYQQSH